MTALRQSIARLRQDQAGRFAVATRFAVVSFVGVVSVSCGRSHPPPYSLAFTLTGGAFRVVESSQQTIVPIQVTNTGTRGWNPSQIHVSYHWLWLVPRELASPSRWDVPYQDGIRTELAAPIAPGAGAALDARLLPPSVPGLYWLQWDMVEEGVTWFSQVSPRQPRRLIVVVPTLAGAVVPLPLLVAIVALVAISRAQTASVLLAAADVIWCCITLLSKQLQLVPEALLEPTAVAYWLMVVAATMPPIAVMLTVARRPRRWALFAMAVLGSVVVLADVLYFRFFGDVASTPAVLAARQTGHVVGSIRSLFGPGLLWLVVDLPFGLWMVLRLNASTSASSPRRAKSAAAIAVAVLGAVGLALSPARVLADSHLDQIFRNRALVEQLGPFGFHAYDTWTYLRTTVLRPEPTDAQIHEARAWFAARAPLRAPGQTFGIARGKNLIVVQVESLQDFAVDFRVEGQEVMPNLRRWSGDSLRFTNVTDQTSEGRSSDAEFTTLVSLLPLDHGAVAFRYPGNHYVALPRILSEHGYATLSAVPFEPGFWNRRVMHPAYGFQQSLFENDFTMTEQIGWGLNDRDFLAQMVPRLEKLPRPFCAWLITLSLHHPFDDFPDRHKVLRLGALERTPFGNYLHTMHFFDEALETFRAALAGDGLLADTVLVVFGDHDAGFAHTASLAKTIGLGPDEASWALNDRIPLFVRSAGLVPGAFRTDTPAGQTDFAPTMLALLGVDATPLPYVGRNLLGAPDDPPILRPYGDWLDSSFLFVSHGEAHSGTCYAVAAQSAIPLSRCDAADAHARKARDISRFVVTDDLQEQLR